MSNLPYPSSSDPSFNEPSLESSNPATNAELSRTIQDIRVDNTRLNSDIQQLRGRTTTLVGLVVGLILLMTGGFVWLAISLQTLEKEEQRKTDSVDSAIFSQVEQLEKQVNDLSQNIPGNLTDTLQSNQKTLTQLQAQLQQTTTQIKALEASFNNVQPQPKTSTQAPPPSNQQSSESPQPTSNP
ncbi:hypothetical protein [Acaryochloris sp. CCMEE 5410]|uniref:hypothetical protein n=1 Tax=Acaryochloris sp. CCMEE 5410 TaxID=310037 RepID=UPI0002483FF1|nr:hypothetical protein [Acaryochloris sp. CCMEE 5410]KAI9132280.1 hypothetical protein ON05_002045 [Acaryochloris sp. CCMEE 5410]